MAHRNRRGQRADLLRPYALFEPHRSGRENGIESHYPPEGSGAVVRRSRFPEPHPLPAVPRQLAGSATVRARSVPDRRSIRRPPPRTGETRRQDLVDATAVDIDDLEAPALGVETLA